MASAEGVPAASGPGTRLPGSDANDQPAAYTSDAANPKGRYRKRQAAVGGKQGKGDGKGKGEGRRNREGEGPSYQVDGERLQKYLNENREVAQRGFHEWKKYASGDKRLANKLAGLSGWNLENAVRAAEHDDLLLPSHTQGALLEPETELEKTYKVSQDAVKAASSSANAAKGFGLSLDGGPFAFDYTRNGRHLALAGHRAGHLAALDWHAARLMSEAHVNETTRAVRWLHDSSFFAVAQRRYVYIYTGPQAVEVHQLRGHIEVTRMEFLPYHWLLATIGNPGWLKYHDTSTGQLVAELRTKLGGCATMCQNPHNAIINLGHQNGTVTLWSPGLSQPHVKLLAHRGPVTGVAVDPSSSGRIMSTTGLDGGVKVWDCRTWKQLAGWQLKKPASSVAWSQKGLMALGWGAHVSIYAGVGRDGGKKGAYMTQLFPGEEVSQVQFCPYEDVLGVGHSAGFTSLLVPGAGEAHFDSLEADPFESKNRRREREVRALLDKIPADLITLNPDLAGSLQEPVVKENPERAKLRASMGQKPTPYRKLTRDEKLDLTGRRGIEEDVLHASDDDGRQSKTAGDDEQTTAGEQPKATKEKKKMRGKNASLKRLMRKKRKNVITPETEAIKAKMAARREALAARKRGGPVSGGALARFGGLKKG